MDKKSAQDAIDTLMGKAKLALDADQAMRYAQAACNVANAVRALAEAEAAGRR